ncbi:MAG: hypothetical protein V5786_12105 [Psychromonas sp.]
MFYSIVIFFAFFVTPLTLLSSIFYLLLFLIALYAAKKAYLQSLSFMVSETGLVERTIGDRFYYGKISRSSFYNSGFIFLILEMSESLVIDKNEKQYITIYHDAITTSEYRLLARLINSGRD